MLETIEKVTKYAVSFENAPSFFQAEDQLYFHATTHLLLAIGEESKKLESELKVQFPEIP